MSRRAWPFSMLLFVCLAAQAQPAVVPVFTPNPAAPDRNVQMSFVLNRPDCGGVVNTSVTVTGNAVRVDYVLDLLPGFICLATPAPTTPVLFDLGGFAPGNYTVTAAGVDLVYQEQPPVVTGGFGVLVASNVPAISIRAGGLLVLLALAGAAIALTRRTSLRR